MIRKLLNRWRQSDVTVKASIAYIICSFFQRGISALTVPIYTRLLTTDQYGYYNVFASWLDIVSVFTTLKLAGGIFTQSLVKLENDRPRYVSAVAGLGTFLTIVALVIYYPLRGYFNKWMGISTDIMICILICSWASLIFEMWAVNERVEYKYISLIKITVLTTVAKPLLGIVSILISPFEYKAYARIVSFTIVEVFVYSWLFIAFIKKGKCLFSKDIWTRSLSLNIPLIPHYLSRTILNQSDRIMIKSMVSYSTAGIYSLAYSLAVLLTLFTTAILNSFNPWIFQRIKKNEYDRLAKVSYQILTIVASLALGLIAFAPEIVKVFAPIEYYEAIWIIPPVTISVFFLFMYSLFADFEFYYEETKFMTVASSISALLNIVLNYICIRHFGYIAAGYTTLVCYIFYAVFHYWAMNRIIKKYNLEKKIYNLKVIIMISLLLLILSGFIMSTYTNYIVRYSIIGAMCIVLFVFRNRIISIAKQIRQK